MVGNASDALSAPQTCSRLKELINLMAYGEVALLTVYRILTTLADYRYISVLQRGSARLNLPDLTVASSEEHDIITSNKVEGTRSLGSGNGSRHC